MFVQNSIQSAWFVCRCYARALKLMSEVPSLWHDLGLNYYHQSCLPCCSEGDQNATCLLLVKAQEVRQNLTHAMLHYAMFDHRIESFYFFFTLVLQCLKKAVMLDNENHNYWNALGVISMSKGNVNHVTFICTIW